VLVMAKAPRAGLVKTRLHPLLGPQGCAHLQTGLIRRTVLVAQLVAPTRTIWPSTPWTAQGSWSGWYPPASRSCPSPVRISAAG